MKKDLLELFSASMKEVAKSLHTSVEALTRPNYLGVCADEHIEGLSLEDIQNFGGFYKLKKAMLDSEEQYKQWLSSVPTDITLDLEEIPITDEEFDSRERDYVLGLFRQYVQKFGFLPTKTVFVNHYEIDWPSNVYHRMDELVDDYFRTYNDEAEKFLCDGEFIWTADYRKKLRDAVNNHKKFIITSVSSNSKPHQNFLKALRYYADSNNAVIIGLPLYKNNPLSQGVWNFDREILQNMFITFTDIRLNNNLLLQVIRNNYTQRDTTVGLEANAGRNDASIITSGHVQRIKYVPVLKHKTPYMVASPGCCTIFTPVERRNKNPLIMSKSEKIVDTMSTLGALIVDVQDEEIFSVRNIEANDDGSFIDLGVKWKGGEVEGISGTTLVVGDLHAPKHNESLLQANLDVANKLNVSTIVLHDGVNMAYVSHHNTNKATVRATMAETDKDTIVYEAEEFAHILDYITEQLPSLESIVIPPSNHPQHLDRYIDELRFMNDPVNLRTGCLLTLAMLDGHSNVLQYLMEDIIGYNNPKVHWLQKDESYQKYGVEIGLHGSESVNGGKATTKSFNKAFRKCITAHKHTPCIDGSAIVVGIACEKDQGYNYGLSSWTESSALLYPDGKAQLITFVNVKGQYKLWL